MTEAYEAGRAAFHAGADRLSCPYPAPYNPPRTSADADVSPCSQGAFWLDGFEQGAREMTPANYGELCAEHLVGVSLVEAISNAIRRAQKACPTLDTGLFEDALSDFRGGLSTLNDELTSYEGNQF